MKTLRLATIAAALTASFLASNEASAFNLLATCWWNDTNWSGDATAQLSPVSFPTSHPSRGDLVLELGRWNAMQGMWFDFSPIINDSDGTFAMGNGANEFVWHNTATDGALAVTTVRFDACFIDQEIEEADMVFDNTITWEFGDHDPRQVEGATSFRFTAVHEAGHFLGLDHEPNTMAVLLTTASGFHGGSSTNRSAPFGDDARGARRLYPTSPGETDFSISNFRWVSMDATALILPTGVTTVRRGRNVTTGFAFTNQGTTSVSFPFMVFLSTNSIISTADRPLVSGTGFADPGFFGDFTFAVTIPADVAPGDYFIGAILDPGNTVPEQRESNNIVAFPGTIRVTR
jgi:hypothetical protein